MPDKVAKTPKAYYAFEQAWRRACGACCPRTGRNTSASSSRSPVRALYAGIGAISPPRVHECVRTHAERLHPTWAAARVPRRPGGPRIDEAAMRASARCAGAQDRLLTSKIAKVRRGPALRSADDKKAPSRPARRRSSSEIPRTIRSSWALTRPQRQRAKIHPTPPVRRRARRRRA